MKLPREFIQLPLAFEAERLADEVRSLPIQAWQAHPTGYAGNTAVPLISVNGEANDIFSGPMAETPWLKGAPYLRQVLTSFQVVLGRSRLMGLAGGSEVPWHSDVNYHWFTRVRIHVPIITFPEVLFHCHDQVIHMGAGEAWIFDNWRAHRVVNPTGNLRVHLVADTVGSSAFWAMVQQSIGRTEGKLDLRRIDFSPATPSRLLLEKYNTLDVMNPVEMEMLTEDLIRDLLAGSDPPNPPDLERQFVISVRGLYQDWKSLWAVYGADQSGWSVYEQRRNRVLKELSAIRQPLVLGSNKFVAQNVMLARVLVACVNKQIPGMNEIQFVK
ncbi:MAG: aspartyl/asparaginyl beta-hydroxylase domain-containing protein [Lysobacterales bacterium]